MRMLLVYVMVNQSLSWNMLNINADKVILWGTFLIQGKLCPQVNKELNESHFRKLIQ